MSSQHYSLRWNNHQSHVLSAFDALLQNESLVDCTLVCEDTSIRAHKVVLSACSPYFQKIFTDNSCKHPIIVLKDIRGWEVTCIVDFMYKGETSVPESQLSCLIKAAESLKVRGLTSSDQYHRRCLEYNNSPPGGKVPHLSGPPYEALSRSESPSGASSSGQMLNHPRRKQARPRRRSGDSIGGASSSLDLSRKSPEAPENLSMKQNEASPAINLVKTETLLEPGALGGSGDEDNGVKAAHQPYHHGMNGSFGSEKSSPKYGQMQEQEARVEALQALNYMASGGGLPGSHVFPLNGGPPTLHHVRPGGPPVPPGHPPSMSHHHHHQLGRESSTPLPPAPTPTKNSSSSEKSGFEFQRISIDRSKMSEEEAFEHAIEMIQTRQMGFRKAADFFSVSKWKLYKTARKRGIYAEIKKQNQAQQSLSKVPSNVQHFADMGVYKQLKKKAHLTKEILFPHLPTQSDTETLKVYKAPTNNNNVLTPNSHTAANLKNNNNNNPNTANNNNNNNNNNNYSPNLLELQKKLFHSKPVSKAGGGSEPGDEEEDDEDEEEERVLVINHREIQEDETEIDSDRDDSA